MTDMMIAAPLAAALAAKGYETLTAVQKAVIAPELVGRDALVSAQTGSGKTVAFGLAMAPEILGESDKLLYADRPLALVVAPTRELALQVRREFEWLYGEAGAQLASCVGGMDYRTERRALERGAHIVVGTPGRLRDHIERGSLDLSGLKAVVLDEADEMLDLGFAEDLEFILAAAPEERRTLMFSATVPAEIEKLASTFQRDALRIAAQGEAKQHVDIEYRALSVAARDKEHAIFNVLRFYEARTAIVFCKTRANVNHLLARMGNRGFQVVALSGELSQQERTHALQALRDGRARVCIATDVAARGIDLPGLELVVHADLPSNSETLLHRSGRTGRAGKKGVSALIVPPAEYRKAQRLLSGAKVVADWGKAPSADEVQSKDDVRLMEHAALQADLTEELDMAQALIDRYGAEQVAAAFVRQWREGRSAPEELSDSAPPAAQSAPRERGTFGPAVWFTLSVGHTGRAEARWLLPKICDGGSITKDAIGAIRVQQDVTYVQIADGVAARFGAGFELEPGLTMSRIDGEPSLERPERAPRAPRSFDRPERSERAPRPAREDRPAREERPYVSAKPSRFVEDDGAERKPYTPREPREDRKPYAPREDRGDRKPYGERKSFGDRDGERKPYGERKSFGDRDGAPKPYGDRKSFGDKPYTPRAPREDGDAPRKPRWGAEDRSRDRSGDAKPAYKSTGFKSHGGGSDDRPARASGFKSHNSDGAKPYRSREDGDSRPPRPKGEYTPRSDARPPRDGDKPAWKPRAEGSEGRPFKPRAEGGKPAGKFAAKPGGFKTGPKPAAAKPRADAKDTSKRFVPPKKR